MALLAPNGLAKFFLCLWRDTIKNIATARSRITAVRTPIITAMYVGSSCFAVDTGISDCCNVSLAKLRSFVRGASVDGGASGVKLPCATSAKKKAKKNRDWWWWTLWWVRLLESYNLPITFRFRERSTYQFKGRSISTRFIRSVSTNLYQVLNAISVRLVGSHDFIFFQILFMKENTNFKNFASTFTFFENKAFWEI